VTSAPGIPRLEPASADEASQAVRDAAQSGRKLQPVGRGTRATSGALPAQVDALLSTARMDRLIAYEPGDLTLTAEAGMELATLDDRLAEHGQWLPLQAYRRRGTLGGLLATAADGLVDLGYGLPRDLVLGARVVLSDGLLARARGRVVKNVAGYDVPRLMVGSFGTLGALLEVSLKLSPRPARQSTLLLGYSSLPDAFLAARRLTEGPDEPAFLDVICGACEPQLAVGFDGSPERVVGSRGRAMEVAERVGCTGALVLDGDDDQTLRRRLDDPVEHLLPTPTTDDAPEGTVVRWSGRPSHLTAWLERALAVAERHGIAARADVRPALGLAFVGLSGADAGALRVTTRDVLDAGRVTDHAMLLAAPDDLRQHADTVWGPPPPDFGLMQLVHDALDPGGVFATGRFVGGL